MTDRENIKPRTDTENTHKGHRGRMRERYGKNGLDGFQPHEVLEMLLFSSIPQGNTNPTAHALLDTCGTMEKVLEGDTAVHGAGEKTLAMLQETGEQLETLFARKLQTAGKISREQFYTAAVWSLRRHENGIFVLITGRDKVYQEMIVLDDTTPADVLAGLRQLMSGEQACHIACTEDPEALRLLRIQYGRSILGWCLHLSKYWNPKWI